AQGSPLVRLGARDRLRPVDSVLVRHPVGADLAAGHAVPGGAHADEPGLSGARPDGGPERRGAGPAHHDGSYPAVRAEPCGPGRASPSRRSAWRTRAAREEHAGSQPSRSLARAALATGLGGSPSRRPPTLCGTGRPSAWLTALTTSRTEWPWPVPMLTASKVP